MGGDSFLLRDSKTTAEFRVVALEPSDYCYVDSSIKIHIQSDSTTFENEELSDEVGYENVGGICKQIAQIRELVEIPLRAPLIFKTIGVKPPRGILLYGPPGSGKTLIARAVSNETNAYLFVLNGPEIMSASPGQPELKI